jgi:glutamate-1-semialdehyde 2,1-aminomutase
LSLSGHDSWKFLIWDPAHFQDLNKAKTLFLQEMLLNGVLSLGSHNVTVAYDQNAVNRVVSAYKNSLSKLKSVEASQSYDIDLHGEPVQPLFKIR